MDIKPIRSQEDLTAAFTRIEQLWGADIGSPEGDELEILALLIEKYEDEHYPMPPSDPIEAIKFRMEQQGLTPRDLEPFIGTSDWLTPKARKAMAGSRRLGPGARPMTAMTPPVTPPRSAACLPVSMARSTSKPGSAWSRVTATVR